MNISVPYIFIQNTGFVVPWICSPIQYSYPVKTNWPKCFVCWNYDCFCSQNLYSG